MEYDKYKSNAKVILIIPAIFMFVLLTSCLKFGENWNTSRPDSNQIHHAESFTALNLTSSEYSDINIDWTGDTLDPHIRIIISLDQENLSKFLIENKLEFNLRSFRLEDSLYIDIYQNENLYLVEIIRATS